MTPRYALLPAALALLLALPAGAQAQEDPEKQEQQIQVFKREGGAQSASAARPGARGPRLRAEDAVRVFQAQSQAKRDEAILTLEQIIRASSTDDPQLPDYLFRLSEQYWEKAHFFKLRAYGYDDEIWSTEKTEPARHAQLKRLKQEDLKRQDQYREKTIEVYKRIIKYFPTYARLDHVLFYLGFNFRERGENGAAQKIFTMLIKRYPESQFIPDTLLAFGEIFFEANDIEAALRFYGKAAKYTDSKVYGFALYKQAWCMYNLGQYREAMERFILVIRYSESQAASSDRNRITLKREAQGDLVRTYSHFGSGSKAIAFFRKIAPDDFRLLSEKLARLYVADGKTVEATKLYRQLIKLDPTNPRVVDYQYEIAAVVERKGDKKATTTEVKRLVKAYRHFLEAGKLDEKAKQLHGRRIGDMLRDLATTWHREAQVTKNDLYLAYAYSMYKEYVLTFPEAKDIYLMTFYFAELLFKIKKWDEAAQYYERVIEIDPKGKFAKEAAHATVLAYQKLLGVGERRETRGGDAADLAPDGDGKEGGKPMAAVPAAKPIPESQKRFVTACDRYGVMVPGGDRVVDVKYFSALVFYDHNHFDDAIKRFYDIIDHHGSHRLAIYAANLVLDSYNLKQDYAGLNKAVDRFLQNKQVARGEFLDELMRLREGASFGACLQHEKEKRYREAAEGFLKFVGEFPTSRFYDKALYNAALDFERVKDIASAIKTRLRLIRERPDSPLVRKALYAIAGNFHASAVYSQAAKSYEVYAERYPDSKEAEASLANAAIFRRGLGNTELALRNYTRWLEVYGRKKRKEGAAVALTIARVHLELKHWGKAVRSLADYHARWARYADRDDVIVAHTLMGRAYLELNNTGKARKAFTAAVAAFTGLPKPKRKALVDGREAAAHARFELGELLFKDFEAAGITSIKKLKDQVLEKVRRMAKAQEVYLTVIDIGHPNWTIAAMGRIGQGWQGLADAVRRAPPPKGLNEEELMVYQDELDQRAMQFEEQAVKHYSACLELAAKYKWFNDYSVLAESNLGKLDPERFQPINEVRTAPGHQGQPFRSVGFVTEVE